MSKKNVRPYLAVEAGKGLADILAPNGRTIARCHSPRTTRRMLAVLNGGVVSQSDRFGERGHHAPAGKIDGVYQILSANGRTVVSCTSRYVQLMLQDLLNSGAPAKTLRAYRKRTDATVQAEAATPRRGRSKAVAETAPVARIRGTETGRISARVAATSARPRPAAKGRGYTGPAFSPSLAA